MRYYEDDLESIREKIIELKNLEDDILAIKDNELYRMRQVAISVISKCNTQKSFDENKLKKDSPYYTLAYEDVCETVQREISLLTRGDFGMGHSKIDNDRLMEMLGKSGQSNILVSPSSHMRDDQAPIISVSLSFKQYSKIVKEINEKVTV